MIDIKRCYLEAAEAFDEATRMMESSNPAPKRNKALHPWTHGEMEVNTNNYNLTRKTVAYTERRLARFFRRMLLELKITA